VLVVAIAVILIAFTIVVCTSSKVKAALFPFADAQDWEVSRSSTAQ